MNLGEISFCDKLGFNVKSDDYKKKVLADLEKKISFKVIQKHYDKFDETKIPILNQAPHLINVRSNGNPYILYLTKHNFVNQCIFIDKKVQQNYYFPRMILTKFRFANDLFEDTILDGEMVKDSNNTWVFLINDMICHKGVVLGQVNLVKRINMVYELLATQFVPDELDCCLFRVKKYFEYHEIQYMIDEFVPKLSYTCRGLYIKPLFLRFRDVLYNFDDSLIKKVERIKFADAEKSQFLLKEDFINDKPVELSRKSSKESIFEEKSIEISRKSSKESGEDIPAVVKNCKKFCIKKTPTPDIYEMYDPTDPRMQTLSACINTMATSKMMKNAFVGKNPTDIVSMVCEYSDKFKKWIPVKPC